MDDRAAVGGPRSPTAPYSCRNDSVKHPPPAKRVSPKSGETPFGALVYGFGQYTSYMVPGGLNLEPISLW